LSKACSSIDAELKEKQGFDRLRPDGVEGQGAKEHRFAALDSLRGLCAVIVVLFHFKTEGALTNLLPIRKGWLFVDFFFVLSGFVLAHAYFRRIGRDVSVWRFLGLRLGRIYPLHIAILLAMLALELALWASNGALASRPAFAPGHGVGEWIASALLLNSSGFTDTLVWNGPSWSIAAEFWAYVLFALLVLTRRVWPFAITAVAALVTLLLFQPDLHEASYGFGTVRCIYGFSLGVLLWAYRSGDAWQPTPALATAAELFMVAAIIVFTSAIWSDEPTLLGPPLFACAVFVFASDAGLVSRLLRAAPFVAIGTLSYSIYMVHPFVQPRLMELFARFGLAETGTPDRLLLTGWAADAATLLMLAIVIAVTYRCIEVPARRWSRRKLRAPTVEKVAPTF
jgi:peptidoglycan/LPS O-acetylase OafA/YrhL